MCGAEEGGTIERVVRFIDILGYREITLKSDTEPAIVAFMNRVSAMCKAEVIHHRGSVKGDKSITCAHRECDNSVAWNHSKSQSDTSRAGRRDTR